MFYPLGKMFFFMCTLFISFMQCTNGHKKRGTSVKEVPLNFIL